MEIKIFGLVRLLGPVFSVAMVWQNFSPGSGLLALCCELAKEGGFLPQGMVSWLH